MRDFGGVFRERRQAMGAFAPIPSGTVDFTALPERERLDAMRETLRPFYEVGVERASEVVCEWSVWNLDRLLFSKARFSSLMFEHAPRRLKGVDHECLLVETYLEGSGDGVAGDRLLRLRPGSIQITDLSRRFVNATTAVSTYGVLIPHAAVGYDPSRHPSSISLPSDGPRGRVLLDALLTQFRLLDYVGLDEAPRLAHRFAALVSELALSPDEPCGSQAVIHARRLAIDNFIETRIGSSGLRVRNICAAFHMSRASLYRHFPEEGGIARYIRTRRVARAVRELAMRPVARGQISAAAERWGFSDAGHLHRLVKRQFGQSPSELAGSQIPSAGPASHARALSSWYRRIF